ncbi:hypothetical protein KIPE111705_46440 [Kibdelosporangium persicum]
MPEYHRRLGAHQVQQHGERFRSRQRGKLGRQCGFSDVVAVPSRFGRHGARGSRDLLDQGTATGQGVRRYEPVPVDGSHGETGLVVVECLLQRGHRLLRWHRLNTVAGKQFRRVAVRHAATGPAAPGDGRRGQAAAPAILGQRVQEGVARRVDPLAAAAPHSRARGEQHERRQLLTGQQFVEVRGAVGLRGERPGQIGRGGSVQRGDVVGPRHVEHRVHR